MIRRLEDINFNNSDEFIWIAAQIRFGEEAEIERRFRRLELYKGQADDIESFACPEFTEPAFVKGKRVDEDFPLFPAYLLIKIRKSSNVWQLLEKEDRSLYQVITGSSKRTGRILLSIKSEEIKELLNSINTIKKFSIGTHVLIKSSAFRNLTGRIETLFRARAKVLLDKLNHRVLVNLENLEILNEEIERSKQ